MDSTQLLLTIVLTISTVLLTIVGLQLIFLLKDVRLLVKKINLIIEGLEKVGLSFEHGLSEVMGFISSIKTILKVIDLFHKKTNEKPK